MIAYFVYNAKEDRDIVVIPESGCTAAVDGNVMTHFISAKPDFTKVTGEACSAPVPEDFGKVVATREENGDVCIRDAALWQRRMAHHLGTP